jgi:predicted metal-dependent hydrolase
MPIPPCREPPAAGLLAGIEEFNREEFFECHKTLEELWRVEPRPIRHLFQGILQIGVAFHHLKAGRYRPAVALLTRGHDYLRAFSPVCMMVHVDRLLEDVAICLQEVERLGADNLSGFDWSLVPRIGVGPIGSKVGD